MTYYDQQDKQRKALQRRADRLETLEGFGYFLLFIGLPLGVCALLAF